MRFRRWPRVSAYQDMSRKRAALARAQQAQRDKLPLLAPLIAEKQPSADAEMARRAAWWPKVQQDDRDRRANDWRRARARLAAYGDNLRPVLVQLWRGCPYPADPVYLLDLLHSINTGRIDPERPPWNHPCMLTPRVKPDGAAAPEGEEEAGFVTVWRSRERLPAGPSWRTNMATANPKIVLSTSRDIPFNKLVLSQANVRRVKAGVSVEELAEDIARRTLLQSLSVRPVLDAEGAPTGTFEVPAGGRRFRALELLVKQKRLAKHAPVPCVIRTDGLPEEDSLAENVQRAPLHPLDQFRAFLTLREAGLGEEEIAARFFVNPAVVKQRLKLASVSPKLLDIYAEDEMTLEQLMAFTVTVDHARQEQVWEDLSRSYNKEPYYVRKLPTEGAVRASDKRAQFVGIEAYEAAGGVVMRDLFQQDDGGWLQDPALLDRLVAEMLQTEAAAFAAEGWKWIEVAAEFPYGHTSGLRRLTGEAASLTDEERASYDALRAEYDKLEEIYAEADELPEEVDQRLGEIETALEAFDDRPVIYVPAEIARAGVFVSVDGDGDLRIERGYVRPEDEAPAEPEADGGAPEGSEDDGDVPRTVITIGGDGSSAAVEAAEEEDGIKPLPDRLVTELTAHRTLALRNAVHEPWNRNPRRIVHAGQVARAVGLDMVAAGWTPTVDNYLGRVTKARILEAVREAKGEASAQLIDHLKKPDMAKEAERLLAGLGWLPEPLRMPTVDDAETEAATVEAENLPAFLDEDESAAAAGDPSEPQTVAAE